MKQSHDNQLAETWLQQERGRSFAEATAHFAAHLCHHPHLPIKELLMEIGRATSEEVNALWAATIADQVPTVARYPQPDLTFLPKSTAQTLPFAAIQSAVAEGILHISDQLYGVFALVGRSIQGQAIAVAVSRSALQLREPAENSTAESFTPSKILLRYELGKREGFAWEMEVTASTETTDLCTVEVSLFDPDQSVADVAITLYDGKEAQTQMTNNSGIVVFPQVDRKRLDKLIIHRALDN